MFLTHYKKGLVCHQQLIFTLTKSISDHKESLMLELKLRVHAM